MRNVALTSKFKKDLKAAQKTPRFKKYAFKFEEYVEKLRTGESLPPESKNHPLAKHSPKEYGGCYDFHVAPDLCVVSRMTASACKIVRICQHNNLGLTENYFE
jgi:addiction module RelE/StbE family toxin